MGLLFVLAFWCFASMLLLLPAVAIGRRVGRMLVRNKDLRLRKQFGRAGALLPILIVVYLACCACILATVSVATGRDLGLGDSFELPLPNGYSWIAIDLTSRADIQRDSQTVVPGVVALQVNKDWVAGGTTNADPPLDDSKSKPTAWFLLNTQTSQQSTVASESALAQLTAQQGFPLHLQSSSNFYASRRWTWHDAVLILLLLLPGMLLLSKLLGRARHMMKQAHEP